MGSAAPAVYHSWLFSPGGTDGKQSALFGVQQRLIQPLCPLLEFATGQQAGEVRKGPLQLRAFAQLARGIFRSFVAASRLAFTLVFVRGHIAEGVFRYYRQRPAQASLP